MLLVNTIVLKVEILQSYSAMKHLILGPTEPEWSHLPVMSRTLNLAHSPTKHTHTHTHTQKDLLELCGN